MRFAIGQQYLGSSLGDANNSVVVTLGDNLTGDPESGYAQMYQQVGFCSLPPNSVPGQACAECIVLIGESNRNVVIGTRHPNSQNLYGNMNPGDTIMYGSGPDGTAQSRVKANGDGSVTLMTTDDNTPTGKTCSVSLSPKGELKYFSPFGKMIFDATGFHITTASGASFHLGNLSLGGLAVPGLNLNNYCLINSDLINIAGTTVKLGKSSTGVYLTPVLAPVGSLTPGTPAPSPVVVPITGQGVTATSILMAI